MKKRILMIDDDISFLTVYSEILKSREFEAETAPTADQGIQMLADSWFDLVILDVVMPDRNGIQVLKQIREEYPFLQVMMLTGEGSISDAVESMEAGAYTYLTKPLEIEQLLASVQRAVEYGGLRRENRNLKERIGSEKDDSALIGKSPVTEEIRRKLQIAAPTGATVLITGESGTGKEIAANLLHQCSDRRDGPFIKVNCAALAESVLESELFGHERGAFTGAAAMKPGRFELAHGGTLFLDEIGEMSLHLQSKLLRVLQSKELERVGGTRTIHVDFRLVAATNKNLTEEIGKGNFREDLYYRLHVIPIHMAPLREKREDIPCLLDFFMKRFCVEMKKPPTVLAPKAIQALSRLPWRGNVRELRNYVERLLVFSNGGLIGEDALPLPDSGMQEPDWQRSSAREWKQPWIMGDGLPPYRSAREEFERQYFTFALNQNGWNISATALQIGMDRKNLQTKIKQLQLKKMKPQPEDGSLR